MYQRNILMMKLTNVGMKKILLKGVLQPVMVRRLQIYKGVFRVLDCYIWVLTADFPPFQCFLCAVRVEAIVLPEKHDAAESAGDVLRLG